MRWLSLIIGLIPEVVRGVIGICKAKIELEKERERAKRADKEQNTSGVSPDPHKPVED